MRVSFIIYLTNDKILKESRLPGGTRKKGSWGGKSGDRKRMINRDEKRTPKKTLGRGGTPEPRGPSAEKPLQEREGSSRKRAHTRGRPGIKAPIDRQGASGKKDLFAGTNQGGTFS